MSCDSADVRIPFGMYLGLTVKEVSGLPDGRKYLLSLLGNRSVSKALQQAIREFHHLVDARMEW